MSPLTEPTRLTLRKSWQPMDPDAAAYITAVETADGQALEEKVKIAIDNFVLGCKADGIWTGIKASCILAGARTFAGALIPLKGIAPTKFGTEGNWSYNRKTGLQGDGSTNYLNSNRNNNTDPQNSRHICVYANLASLTSQTFAGGRPTDNFTGCTSLGFTGTAGRFRSVPDTDTFQDVGTASTGSLTLIGASRSASSSYTVRISRSSQSVSSASASPASADNFIFALNNQGAPAGLSNARLAFYSIGESLNLALLDARVTDLINAFGAAIP